MTKQELQIALNAAAAERDPYDIEQRTPYRERRVEYVVVGRCRAWGAALWLAAPWMPRTTK